MQTISPLQIPVFILRNVRHNAPLSQGSYKLPLLILLVGTQRPPRPASRFVQQAQGRLPLGSRPRLGHTGAHDQSMIVFRQHMSQIARLGRSRIAFAIQSGLGIGAALMGVAQQPLAATPAAPLRGSALG